MAIIESPDGPPTYAELAGDAHQLVHLFRSVGSETGDGVAVLADNGARLIQASLACHEAGFRLIPLNTHLTARELEQIIDHSGAGVLIVDERFAPLLANPRCRTARRDGVGGRQDRRRSIARCRPVATPQNDTGRLRCRPSPCS